MRKLESTVLEARMEVVTTTFVAAGKPVGIHDLDRLIEALNNGSISRYIEIESPVVRPLYRAGDELHLDAALLIRREEIVFANFEGPSFPRGAQVPVIDAPVLLLAPPFQIQGTVSLAPGSDPTQALRMLADGFFSVRRASVFDADGNALGDGDQIIVNGAAIQMTASTQQHIEAALQPQPHGRPGLEAVARSETAEPQRQARAA